MGLLALLGLAPPQRADASAPPPGEVSKGDDAGAHAPGDAVLAKHDEIGSQIKAIGDDKARDALDGELAALRAKHATAPTDAARRAAFAKAELAAADLLAAKVTKAVAADHQKRERSDARADVDAVIAQVATVLQAIVADAPHKRLAGELATLKAAFLKADKAADAKAAVTAFNAVLASAQAVLARAQGTKEALDFAATGITPLLAPAQAAVTALPAAPQAVLQKELDALKGDVQHYAEAGDSTALQSIVQPRLAKLNQVATGLAGTSAKVDADLSRAAKLVQPLDATASADLRTRLAALQEQKKNAWPGGNSLDEIASAVDAMTQAARAIAAEAQTLGPKLQRDHEIALLRKRLDGLKPRTDKASEAGLPPFYDGWQAKVRDALANFAKYESASDLKSCEVVFSQLGAALDTMEELKTHLATHRTRFAASRDGPVKAALAIKLVPATLAALRTRSLESKGLEIQNNADSGWLAKADKGIDDWLKQAKTWGQSQAAYNNLRSGHPVVGAMKDLIDQPGGGDVFDAIVADLPEDTEAVNVKAAIDARFGIQVKQFNHRTSDEADGKAYPDKSQEVDSKAPQDGLKDLYKTLRQVPLKDAKYIEKIVDYKEQGHGAYFQPGVINDKIVMYAGRPGDAHNEVALGGVVAPGERPDPNAEPVGGSGVKVNWYNFAALHELGHGVDDARGVMKSHMAEAGWESHSAGDIAKKVATFFSYDADYIESMMKDKASNPPKRKPKRPADVKTEAEWESSRRDAENWVRASRESGSYAPWDDGQAAKDNAIGGRVYQEAYAGDWVSYHLAARATGIRGYQFRAPGEWFAELYAAFYAGKLKPSHPDIGWLRQVKAQSES